MIFIQKNSSAQFVNFEDTWKEFLANNKISNISEMPKPKKNQPIDYLRYCLMVANTHFCSGDIGDAENMMAEVKKMGKDAYKTIPGYGAKHDDLSVKIKAYHQVEFLWKRFLKTKSVSLEELEKVAEAKTVCEKGTLAKYFYMVAHAHYCKGEIAEAKGHFEGRVLKLAERTSLKVEDITGLAEEVKTMKFLFINLPKLGKAWKEYQSSGESKGFDIELPVIECYSIPSMKEYVLRGASDVCKYGNEMLQKINKLKESNSHSLPSDLKEGISWLQKEVEKNNKDVANLNKSWKQFMPKDTLLNGINFGFEYCDKESEIRAYTMDGRINYCNKGEEILEKINAIKSENKPDLKSITLEKIKNLEIKLEEEKDNVANLNQLWDEFISNKDTILEPFDVAGYFCDKIALAKSWTIKGHMDACKKGQHYINNIDHLKQQESLEFDEELACRIRRLRIKVWDCRYWE